MVYCQDLTPCNHYKLYLLLARLSLSLSLSTCTSSYLRARISCHYASMLSSSCCEIFTRRFRIRLRHRDVVVPPCLELRSSVYVIANLDARYRSEVVFDARRWKTDASFNSRRWTIRFAERCIPYLSRNAKRSVLEVVAPPTREHR